ncbi:hypothetical protein ACO2JO_06360 [Leptospira interrogans]
MAASSLIPLAPREWRRFGNRHSGARIANRATVELVRQVKSANPARPIPKLDRPVCNNSLGALDRFGFIGAVQLDGTDDGSLKRQCESQVAFHGNLALERNSSLVISWPSGGALSDA